MYIQIEQDYNANDNKGMYVHINYSEDEREEYGKEKWDVEGDIALVRIENGLLIWYENQNGVSIDTAIGDTFNVINIQRVIKWMEKAFPGVDMLVDFEVDWGSFGLKGRELCAQSSR